MNIAEQIAVFRKRGFTDEQAEVIALMRLAVGVLFQAFPESFVLFGGATLLLFHDSLRYSGDLDLLSRTDVRPSPQAVSAALAAGLNPAAEALGFAPLQFEVATPWDLDLKLWVHAGTGRRLFRVDLSRFGSVLASQIEDHEIGLEDNRIATVKAASRDFLLLQKAECFLLRKVIKVRDAFDIKRLTDAGGSLDLNLKSHFRDTLLSFELESADIVKRIAQVEPKRCRNELQPLLPAAVFAALAGEGFQSLRDRLCQLYGDWL